MAHGDSRDCLPDPATLQSGTGRSEYYHRMSRQHKQVIGARVCYVRITHIRPVNKSASRYCDPSQYVTVYLTGRRRIESRICRFASVLTALGTVPHAKASAQP